MWKRELIRGVPGVVPEEARFAITLILDGNRGELKVLEVTNEAVRQEDPKLALDELGELFAEEVGMIIGRLVSPTLEAGVLKLVGPRVVGGEDGDTLVTPFSEERRSQVVDLVQLGGEVGTPSKVVYESFPGLGSK